MSALDGGGEQSVYNASRFTHTAVTKSLYTNFIYNLTILLI